MTIATSSTQVRARRQPVIRTFLARLNDLIVLRRQRQDLASLDDHMLEDIGMTRGQVQAEARRGFWDAPATWRS